MSNLRAGSFYAFSGMPIFMPIVKMPGFDPVWFGVLMLINFETGFITPPFGMLLFVIKGVAPDLSIMEIC